MTQATALVQIPSGPGQEAGLSLLCNRAEALGAHVRRTDQGAVIDANSGSITATRVTAGVELAVAADSAQGLEMLRAAIDGFAQQSGFAAPDWRSAALAPAGKSRLMATRLVSKNRLSPSYYRIRLAGDFDVFTKGGLHFRLLLGPEGAALPENGPEGIVWPAGIDAWHRPPYTVRAVSPAGDWLDFDVFVHEGGRVTEWCEEVSPGATVMLTGPGGRGVKQAGWMGMIADETALPVVLRAIEAAGATTQGEAMIVVPDPADRQDIALPPGFRLHWIGRQPDLQLTDLLARLSPPASDRFVFFAGERTEAEAARLWAKSAGLSSGEFLAAAYWTAGWVPPPAQRQARGRA